MVSHITIFKQKFNNIMIWLLLWHNWPRLNLFTLSSANSFWNKWLTYHKTTWVKEFCNFIGRYFPSWAEWVSWVSCLFWFHGTRKDIKYEFNFPLLRWRCLGWVLRAVSSNKTHSNFSPGDIEASGICPRHLLTMKFIKTANSAVVIYSYKRQKFGSTGQQVYSVAHFHTSNDELLMTLEK